MCCFLVPLAQAVATSIYCNHNPGKKNLPALEKMLWGGTVMLIVDHVISGELTWRFPFFTALDQTGGAGIMLREMLTVGVPMSLVLTLVWAVYAVLKNRRTASAGA